MRFDVYKLPKGAAGYLVDVQSDFLSHLATRAVVPLLPAENRIIAVKNLNPVIAIEGETFVLITHEIASILKKQLGRAVTNLTSQQDEINRALDLLLTGF